MERTIEEIDAHVQAMDVALKQLADGKPLDKIQEVERNMKLLADGKPWDKIQELERVLYEKIKTSVALKGYVDYYDRIAITHEDHSYKFLLDSVNSEVMLCVHRVWVHRCAAYSLHKLSVPLSVRG